MQFYIIIYSLLFLFVGMIFLFLPHPVFVILVSLILISTIKLIPRSKLKNIKCIYKKKAIKLYRRQKPNSYLSASLRNFHLFNNWHNQFILSNYYNYMKPNLSIDVFKYKYLFTNIKGNDEVIAQTVSHIFSNKLDLPNFIIASIDSKFFPVGHFSGNDEKSYYEDSGIIIITDKNLILKEKFIEEISRKIKNDLIIEVQGKSAIFYRCNKTYSTLYYYKFVQESLDLLELLCEKPVSVSPN